MEEENETSGSIMTAGHVDYEEWSTIKFTVIATDAGFNELSDIAEVTVDVIDENDNGPEFSEQYAHYSVAFWTDNFSTYLLKSFDNAVLQCFNFFITGQSLL